VVRLVDAFYAAMDRRPDARAIRAMHAEDLAHTKAVLVDYLAEWMGGPKRYSATRGSPMLKRRHHPFNIDDDARDAWMACMREALAATCLDSELRTQLESAFRKIADHIRNTETPSTSTTRAAMSAILAEPATLFEGSAFARLEAERRLLNPVLKAPTHKPGRFGFRGELALRFAAKLADEARPPELTCDQVIAIADKGNAKLPFFAGYLLSFEHLKDVAEALGDTLSPEGKYFLFCNNIDLSKKYQVPYGSATFYVLPIDESTVYNELLELLYLEKGDLKKLDTAGKTDKVADAALKFSGKFEPLTYEDGLKVMGPVRNPNENRPV
jgi:truncated hemoglobin YjbI